MLKRWPYISIVIASLALAYFTDNEDRVPGFMMFLLLFEMPGYFIYMLATGDIHGWQPGPIGAAGRIMVTGLGTALFWCGIVFLVKRIRRKRDNKI